MPWRSPSRASLLAIDFEIIRKGRADLPNGSRRSAVGDIMVDELRWPRLGSYVARRRFAIGFNRNGPHERF